MSDQAPATDKTPGLRNDEQEVDQFMFLWRAGSKSTSVREYMRDKAEYPYFWRDVLVANAMYQEEEDKVRNLFDTADELARQLQAQDKQRQGLKR